MSEEDVFGDHDFDDDVSLDPDDKHHASSDRQDWFKGEKGCSYRVALVYFHPYHVAAMRAAKRKKKDITREELLAVGDRALAKRAEERSKAADQLAEHEKLDLRRVQFRKVLAHYKDGLGYVVSRKGKDGEKADKVWAMLGDQKKYFTTVGLFYPCTREGEVIKDRFTDDWIVKPWRFSGKVYGRLHQVGAGLRSNDLSIATQDLMIKCTNTDFQNFELDGAGRALWLRSDKFRDKVLAAAVKLYKDLNPFREMSTGDVQMKLGLGGDVGEDVSDDEYDDILENI